MIAFVVYSRLFGMAGAVGYIGFDAEDGFDAVLFAGFVEFDGAVHVAVVGQGDGRHTEFLSLFDYVGDFVESVKE